MKSEAIPATTTPEMGENSFQTISEYIQSEAGIKMPPAKKTMLQARLQKRLRSLKMVSFDEYCEFVFSPDGIEELLNMIDVVTTNKTDFFREPSHFDYLVQTALPELLKSHCIQNPKMTLIWSAGCSSGEEPYTLSMVLNEFAEQHPPFGFQILGTDISTNVLEKSQKAIFAEEKVEPIPNYMKKKYLLRGRGTLKGKVRIVPELRSKVQFQRLNFMDNFKLQRKAHIIFCRNVIIYFEKETQEILLNKFYKQLVPGGFIFMGHSETLNGLDVPLVSVAPNVYRRMK